jgi:hypothetical protein
MEEHPGWLIVRSHAPGRRWWLAGLLALLVAIAVYGSFQLGLYRGGFDAVDSAAQRTTLQRQVAQLERSQHQLQVQLAAAQEERVADIRERAAVARTIGELQAQVENQQQSLEFYKGLVEPQLGAAAATSVRVQQFHISALPVAQRFMLKFTLNRMTAPDRMINGTLSIRVDGSQGGSPGSIDLAGLTGGDSELPFDFRYYQHIEQSITLPVAFKPDSVTIEVRPARKDMSPYRQTFVWEVDPI